MTLMNAPKYTARHYRHLGLKIGGAIAAILVVLVLLFVFWNWPSEHRVNRFLTAVQARNYTKAFGIWNNDPDWQQHAQRFVQQHYGYQQFLQDWGPHGSEGVVQTHQILHATSKVGNTVLVAVEINGNANKLLTLSVAKKTHTIGFSPFSLSPAERVFGWTRWGIDFSN